MSVFTAQHATALDQIAAKGLAVTFSYTAKTTNATTLLTTDGATTSVAGSAIRVKGDPREYEQMGLTQRDPMTLLFAADTFGDRIDPRSSVTWNGAVKKVERITEVAIDGPAIISRVVVAS